MVSTIRFILGNDSYCCLLLELHNAVYQYFPSPLMYMGIMAFTAFIFMCSRALNLEINPLKNTDVANTKYLMTLVVMLSIVVVLTGGVNRFFSDGDVYYQEYPIIKHGYRYASRGVLANWFIALNIKGMRYDVTLSTHDYMILTNKKKFINQNLKRDCFMIIFSDQSNVHSGIAID